MAVLVSLALSLCGCGSGGGVTTVAPDVITTTMHAGSTTTTTTTPEMKSGCLCVFDVDRTLTGTQGQAAACPKDKEFPDIHDFAYKGGSFLASDMLQNLNSSFCGQCYMGIVSAGDCSGEKSKERAKIIEYLGGKERTLTDTWHLGSATPITSSLVLHWVDGTKQHAVAGIQKWFESKHWVKIPDNEIHFFDDRKNNVAPFAKTGYNARQVSCASRDRSQAGIIGHCGGMKEELVKEVGIHTCGQVEGKGSITV